MVAATAEREVEGEEEEESRIEEALVVEILVSPAAAKSPETPNSSWIIVSFFFFWGGFFFWISEQSKIKRKEKARENGNGSFLVSGKKIKKVGFVGSMFLSEREREREEMERFWEWKEDKE